MPEHDLDAAAYAIKAARAAHPGNPSAGRVERDWQRDRLDAHIRALVLADQARRNAICWSVFEDWQERALLPQLAWSEPITVMHMGVDDPTEATSACQQLG